MEMDLDDAPLVSVSDHRDAVLYRVKKELEAGFQEWMDNVDAKAIVSKSLAALPLGMLVSELQEAGSNFFFDRMLPQLIRVLKSFARTAESSLEDSMQFMDDVLEDVWRSVYRLLSGTPLEFLFDTLDGLKGKFAGKAFPRKFVNAILREVTAALVDLRDSKEALASALQAATRAASTLPELEAQGSFYSVRACVAVRAGQGPGADHDVRSLVSLDRGGCLLVFVDPCVVLCVCARRCWVCLFVPLCLCISVCVFVLNAYRKYRLLRGTTRRPVRIQTATS